MAVVEASRRLKALKSLLQKSGVASMFGAAGRGAEALADGTALSHLVETAYLVVAADNKVTQGEYDQLVALVSTLCNDALDAATVESGLNAMMDRVDRSGGGSRAAELAQALGDDERRRAALLVAAGLAYADGRLQREEQEALARIAAAFGIAPEERDALLARARDMVAAPA